MMASTNTLTIGGYMGHLEFDGHTVTLARSGAARPYPCPADCFVVFEPAGVGMKGIRFVTSGSAAQGEIMPIGAHKDVATDPNALTFRSGRLDEFKAFAAAIEAAIHTPQHAATDPAADLGSPLANLSQLHAQGVCSDEEFASAKAKLLASGH